MSGQMVSVSNLQPASSAQDSAFLATLTRLLKDATGVLDKDHAALPYLSRAHDLLTDDFRNPAEPTARLSARQMLAPWQATRVRKYIEDNMETGLKIDDLIALTRLSASYFFRAFKGSFGMSPHAYVVKLRIERARYLLVTTDEPLCQVALAVGLTDQAHLSRLFRQQTGSPPGVWRRETRGGICAPEPFAAAI